MNDQTSLTATAKKGVIVISRTWVDPESGRTWLILDGAGWTYDSFSKHPAVVSYKGGTFVKSGWNSDTGTLCYRECNESELAYAVKK